MKKRLFLLVFISLLLVGCNKEVVKENDNGKIQSEDLNNDSEIKIEEKTKITASTYPMYYITGEIGRDNIDLDLLVPIGVDPHEYEVSLKEVKDLENSELFIYNGSGLEHWGEKIAKNLEDKGKLTINASTVVDLLNIEEEDNHEHGNKDPHIWLDPINMEKIAFKIKEELQMLDSRNSDAYEKNYLNLSKKLNDLDNRYNEVLKDRRENTILVSHSAFSYLAHRYGLEQIAITGISPHSEPSPKSLSELINITRKKNIKYIFFEVLSSPKSVEMIAEEANLEVLTLHPIGGITTEQFESGVDYIDLMEDNLDNLKKALVN